jgi:GNAT superfamily N-acetyltransferase
MVTVVDMPPDAGLRRRVAAWVLAEWPHLFPDDTEDWYVNVWSEADRSGTNPPHCVVALVDGEPVGTASVVLDDELPGATEPGPWLAAVYVLPDYRGRGAGRAMVRELMSRMRGPLWLYTEHESDWYRDMGWRHVREAVLNGHAVTVMAWSRNSP